MKFRSSFSIIIISTLLGSGGVAQAATIPKIGTHCAVENQEIVASIAIGGSQMCLKTSAGLVWKSSTTLLATKYLDHVLPKCTDSLYTKVSVSAELRRILTFLVTKHYQERNLLPIKVTNISGVIVNRNLEGINPCSNGVGVPLGSRGGSIPKNASAAWIIYVMHKQNDFGNSNFITIAHLGTSYKIVYEGTSP